MRRGLLTNNTISLPFRVEAARREHRTYLFKETLSLLILLYAHHIEQGTKRISDFSRMTPQEFNRELMIRALITEGQIRSRKESKKKKIIEEETKLLEALKAAHKQ